MKELVTLTERRWIKENAIQMLGKEIKFPVIDINAAIMRIQEERANNNLSPYVEIQPISPDMYKIPNKMATFQKDPMTGVLYGIALTQDDFGNIRWQKIQLHDHMSLNLDKPDDAKIWCILRFYPEIKGSPWQIDNPYYKVYDPTDEAMEEMGQIAEMRKAFNYIEMIQDKPREMILFARYLGEDLRDNSNLNIVTGTLLKYAKNHPKDFNLKWTSKIRSFGERFKSGVAIGLITQDAERGFMYRQIQLGTDEEQSIRFLASDSNIMSRLNHDLAEGDVLVNTLTAVGDRKEEKKKEKKKTDKEVKGPEDTKGPAEPGEPAEVGADAEKTEESPAETEW